MGLVHEEQVIQHSPRDVDEILKAHYLGGQAELAEQAIVKLVAAFGTVA